MVYHGALSNKMITVIQIYGIIIIFYVHKHFNLWNMNIYKQISKKLYTLFCVLFLFCQLFCRIYSPTFLRGGITQVLLKLSWQKRLIWPLYIPKWTQWPANHRVISHSADVFWCCTNWGRVTHICVSQSTIIGSDNGLAPGRHQDIIWTNAGIW